MSLIHECRKELYMTYRTINPANERVLQEFAEQDDAQVGEILVRAITAFRDDWSRRPLGDRRIVLKKAASMLRQRREHFARLVTLEMGKRLDEARAEVDLSADILNYYADHAATFLAPETLVADEGDAWVENTPLGVIFCIEPWNFPYYQLARVAWKEK
jgi:succinate-semialdehyde dehydrogenase/glutarate-semialdehyde dehydrogenase